jgi:hypothetical protein
MPRNSAHSSSIRRRRPRRKTKRATPRNGTTKRNPFAALVVTGVRALIAALPGSTFLSPIADIIFTSLGMSQEKASAASLLTVIDKVAYNGMSGMTLIHYVNILARTPNAALDLKKGETAWVNTPFVDAKLENITITAAPDSIRSKRSGRWAIGFFPFRNRDDKKEMFYNYRPVPLAQLERMAGTVVGPADKPLSLTFRPRPMDGLAYQFNQISEAFGMLVVAYSEDVRTSYHEFTADDWAPNLVVKGTLSLRQPFMAGGSLGFADQTEKLKAPFRASIRAVNESEGKRILEFSPTSWKCVKNDDGTCKVSGMQVSQASLSGSLSDLAME